MNTKTRIAGHLKEHATIYIFMVILFLTGIVFGAIIVNSMNFVQKQDLYFYLERFFGHIANGEQLEHGRILKSSFLYHVKYLLIMFVLGLSVVGLPLVWIFLFLKGLMIGFSVGFIVNQLGMKGLMLASLAIAPQNLIIIPIYVAACSLSMVFSLALLGRLFGRQTTQPIAEPFLRYVSIYVILICLGFGAALMETFISNEAMQAIIRAFYK
ncbi:stage II sporulation protein M [Aciduricibacillus chroicocephali]|uniref:Stage II sporulation protein M n=1 Tax=Aciduricibacillus chroicocephali TaxID=3054939 RepID=A0ABY9KSH8_9BACI|nr:stage II sporulation protein M [Bacillaceae bacterium 44XB]